MRDWFDIDKLKEYVKSSFTFKDLILKFNKVPSGRLKKFLLMEIIKANIDISHFDKYKPNRDRKLKRDKIICDCCGNTFIGLIEGQKIRKFCSKNCACYSNQQKRIKNIKKESKVRSKRKKRILLKKQCKNCLTEFETKKESKIYCSSICGIRFNVKNNLHIGWKSRNILSYPERFFIKVLNKNGLKGKYKINFSIPKRNLGLNCAACYFLDFYFPELNLDLEIDGKQHSYPERQESDKIRDASLQKYGYKIYRIKWKNINSPEGKEYIRNEITKFLEFIKSIYADHFLKISSKIPVIF